LGINATNLWWLEYLGCSCINFVVMLATFLGGCGTWVQCKHPYHILQNIMYCGWIEKFIHHPMWSWEFTSICGNYSFVVMLIVFLGMCGTWVQCKHLYHILQNIMYCGKIEKFVHYPTWNWELTIVWGS
jgi:hypothetical protein